MDNDQPTPSSSTDWEFPTLAHVWDWESRAIVSGADRLEALSGEDRDRCLAALSERVHVLSSGLDDGWLIISAVFMIEDLYKSYFNQFRWTPGVHDYIVATAQTLLRELGKRRFTLHYVIDSVQPESELEEKLTYIPAVFHAAGLFVTGPQLMALQIMQRMESKPQDISAIPAYRSEGHELADQLITRCHQEHRSSVYLNLDLDDDMPGLSLDAALAAASTPGNIVVFRDQPPAAGSLAQIAPPPGVVLPRIGG